MHNNYVVGSYIAGQVLIRCILFSRQAFYYDWTNKKEIILISCIGLFILQHYGTIIFLKIKKNSSQNTSNTLLHFEAALCALWVIYVLFFLLIGTSFSSVIYLELIFNVLPIIIRLISLWIMRHKN